MTDAPWQPLDTPRQYYRWRGQRVAYYVAGSGPPLLLVHSINAAASAFEMRGPFAHLRDGHTVYALDLLGYGGSDRPAWVYTADDYSTLIGDFATDVIGVRCAAIASSLGAAYTIRAAARRPEAFGPLVLVCPTGIEALARPADPGRVYRLLRGPFGDLVFRLLTTRRGIGYFLRRQAYDDPALVDAAVVEQYFGAAYQAGAKYAPICFLTGLLNCRIADELAALHQPLLLVWGREASTTPPSQAQGFLKRARDARLEVFEHARLLVQDEHPAEFAALARRFLNTVHA